MNYADKTCGFEGEIARTLYLVQYVDTKYRCTQDIEAHDTYELALAQVNELTAGGDYVVNDRLMFNIEFVQEVV